MNKKEFRKLIQEQIVILDGATGTELHKRGLPKGECPEKWIIDNEEAIIDIQAGYAKAGSNIVYAPTFGGNRIKLKEYNLDNDIVNINKRLVELSKKAVGNKAYVAGDLAPTGQQIYPVGEYTFEDIVNIYKEQVSILVEAGVDLFVIETMMNIREARAALLAVKETCDLPVMVSMTFEKSGRTLNGTDPISALITLQNLGADAVGCNCSTGPDDMIDIIAMMKPYAKVPLLVKPNAGLPKLINGVTTFDMDSDTFFEYASKLINAGANIIGGCCGTTPEYIEKIVDSIKNVQIPTINNTQGSIICSERTYIEIGKEETIVVGERINPTGKKTLQKELKEDNINYVLQLAKEQVEKGAKILDVNVGMNGIDEVSTMKKAVEQLSVSTETPLCIDSSNIDAIETALRIYPGRALVNSISLEKEKIEKLLPVAAKYGAMFVLLPLDDNGLPETITDKHNIILEVYNQANKYGYEKEDIVVDGLVQTVASNKKAAMETLETVQWCSEVFGCNTIMGLSNISFGLPERKYVNTAFLAMAITKGLTMAIANPSLELFMNIKFACDLLKVRDKDGLNYINRFSEKTSDDINQERSEVFKSVLNGEKDRIIKDVEKMLGDNITPKEIVEKHLIEAITEVGAKFDKKEYFLPQLIRSAETMEVAMTKLEPLLFDKEKDNNTKKPKVILATVKGDVHDIGKNLVGLMFKNHGFEVIDLGKDVESDLIINKAKEIDADIIGLSALMTTTMTEMKVVIDKAKEEKIKSKIMIGGAVITESYAEEINADAYSSDANEAVKVAKKLLSM